MVRLSGVVAALVFALVTVQVTCTRPLKDEKNFVIGGGRAGGLSGISGGVGEDGVRKLWGIIGGAVGTDGLGGIGDLGGGGLGTVEDGGLGGLGGTVGAGGIGGLEGGLGVGSEGGLGVGSGINGLGGVDGLGRVVGGIYP